MKLQGEVDYSKPTILWDLDQTLIDSAHRNNGDLDYWIKNSTLENIMNDKLLPLADVYRSMVSANIANHVCVTSREITDADYQFLLNHKLSFHKILHRGIVELELATAPCHTLKDDLCNHIDITLSYMFGNGVIAFDDNSKNLEMYERRGYDTYDAVHLNNELRKTTMSDRYIFVLHDLTGNQMKNPLAVIDTTEMVAVGRSNLSGVYRIVKSTKIKTETSSPEEVVYADQGISISNGKCHLIGKDEIKAFTQI